MPPVKFEVLEKINFYEKLCYIVRTIGYHYKTLILEASMAESW